MKKIILKILTLFLFSFLVINNVGAEFLKINEKIIIDNKELIYKGHTLERENGGVFGSGRIEPEFGVYYNKEENIYYVLMSNGTDEIGGKVVGYFFVYQIYIKEGDFNFKKIGDEISIDFSIIENKNYYIKNGIIYPGKNSEENPKPPKDTGTGKTEEPPKDGNQEQIIKNEIKTENQFFKDVDLKNFDFKYQEITKNGQLFLVQDNSEFNNYIANKVNEFTLFTYISMFFIFTFLSFNFIKNLLGK